MPSRPAARIAPVRWGMGQVGLLLALPPAQMSHENYHEPANLISEETKNLHRALVSLQEELEAVDWYQQRVDACSDDELRAVLAHNRDEEVEHAMMTLEWLRRKSPVFARNIKKYIGASGPIVEVEKA